MSRNDSGAPQAAHLNTHMRIANVKCMLVDSGSFLPLADGIHAWSQVHSPYRFVHTVPR